MSRYCRTIFTNGKGNNLFQFFYGEVLSQRHGLVHLHDGLDLLGVQGTYRIWHRLLKYDTQITTRDNDFQLFLNRSPAGNIRHRCYPEDYRLYLDYLERFRAQYPPRPATSPGALGVHIRLGDRLIRSETHEPENQLNLESFCKAIDSFSPASVTVFTDMPVWRAISASELSQMRFHMDVKPEERADPDKAAYYFNKIVDRLSAYSPEVRCGYSVSEDFQEMRRYPNFLFQHGTLSWWAAALGHATRVGVYKYWRRGIGVRRNLAETPLPGWFQWE